MGERKVLNKYYPPDFDPKKLPKLTLPKNFQCVIRTMAPFTMRCLTCGNYIYRGKKFNARKEMAEGEDYLGIKIHRFYIRCPVCLTEIIFKTDPKNTDYVVETGAYRTLQAEHLAELEEERLQQEKEEDEANNPMLALENRTKESRREMDVIDALEDIRDWNARKANVKFEELMDQHLEAEKQELGRQKTEDEALVSKFFSRSDNEEIIKRLDDEEDEPPPSKIAKVEKNSSLASSSTTGPAKKPKSKLAGVVMVKKKAANGGPSEFSQIKSASNVTQQEHSEKDSESKSSALGGSLGLAYSDSSSDED